MVMNGNDIVVNRGPEFENRLCTDGRQDEHGTVTSEDMTRSGVLLPLVAFGVFLLHRYRHNCVMSCSPIVHES